MEAQELAESFTNGNISYVMDILENKEPMKAIVLAFEIYVALEKSSKASFIKCIGKRA